MADEGELDLHITAAHLFDHATSPAGVGFVLAVALVRPASQGTLSLVSRNPAAALRIDLNFLAEPEDRRRLLEGIGLARRIGATAPLSALITQELNPGAGADTAEAIERTVLATLDTYHHPTSTAPMGADDDPTAVTDRLGAARTSAPLPHWPGTFTAGHTTHARIHLNRPNDPYASDA